MQCWIIYGIAKCENNIWSITIQNSYVSIKSYWIYWVKLNSLNFWHIILTWHISIRSIHDFFFVKFNSCKENESITLDKSVLMEHRTSFSKIFYNIHCTSWIRTNIIEQLIVPNYLPLTDSTNWYVNIENNIFICVRCKLVNEPVKYNLHQHLPTLSF